MLRLVKVKGVNLFILFLQPSKHLYTFCLINFINFTLENVSLITFSSKINLKLRVVKDQNFLNMQNTMYCFASTAIIFILGL